MVFWEHVDVSGKLVENAQEKPGVCTGLTPLSSKFRVLKLIVSQTKSKICLTLMLLRVYANAAHMFKNTIPKI